jgi:hypothetical protein
VSHTEIDGSDLRLHGSAFLTVVTGCLFVPLVWLQAMPQAEDINQDHHMKKSRSLHQSATTQVPPSVQKSMSTAKRTSESCWMSTSYWRSREDDCTPTDPSGVNCFPTAPSSSKIWPAFFTYSPTFSLACSRTLYNTHVRSFAKHAIHQIEITVIVVRIYTFMLNVAELSCPPHSF